MLAAPRSISASDSSRVWRGSSLAPPCSLSALIVATSTTAEGVRPPCRQTMSKNFCMPMSAPKPDSVTR